MSLPRSPWIAVAVFVAACTSTPAPSTSPSPGLTLPPNPSPTAVATGTALPTVAPSSTPAPTPSASPTPTAPTPTDSATLAGRLQAPLRQVLDDQLAALNIPGMSATIIFPDGSIWSAATGVAQVSPARDATADSPFVAGSITKTFVAATIMQLVDEGQVLLDDPLSAWLPDYPRAGQITLRMLLGHTSGVFNLYESPNYSRLVVAHPHRTWTPQDVLRDLVDEPYCDPGTCFHYSNTGFILLGMVIEVQTGKPLGTVFRERFLAPLGLGATYFQGDGPPPSDSARGYIATKSGNVPMDDGSDYRPSESEGTVIWAAGGIVASAADIARWGRALYGGDVVSADALGQMTDFTFHTGAQGGYYGLGTRMRTFEGIDMVGHTGTLRGFNAAMWYLPSLDLTVVVMTNRTGINANAITRAFLAVSVPAVD